MTVDARLVFLQRAATRFILVEAGEMNLEEAISDLVEQFDQIVGPTPCACVQDMIDRWGRDYPPKRRRAA
jgi:hypothetical protein